MYLEFINVNFHEYWIVIILIKKKMYRRVNYVNALSTTIFEYIMRQYSIN